MIDKNDLGPLGKTALLLASKGFSVFPIAAGTKDQPKVAWTAEATTDEHQIAIWWNMWSDANVGIATGQSGKLVLDVDTKKGKAGLESLALLQLDNEDLPPTLVIETPSGGFHYYFNGSAGSTVERLGSGLDTRGTGGYVLGPGSVIRNEGKYAVHTKGKIADLPEWLHDEIGDQNDAIADDQAVIDLDQPIHVEWAENYLSNDAPTAVEGQGGSDQTFKVASTLRDQGISEELAIELMIDLWNQRCDPPWEEDDLARVVHNANSYSNMAAPGGMTAEADFGLPGNIPDEDETWTQEDSIVPEEIPDDAPPEVKYRGTPADYIWVTELKRFVHREDPIRIKLDKEQFDSVYGFQAEKGSYADALLKSRSSIQKVLGLAYVPGGEKVIPRNLKATQDSMSDLNVWRPSSIQPCSGDVSRFLSHMRYLISDDVERGLTLDYLAHMIQKPGAKMRFALLLQGSQGIGKTWVGSLMSALLGEHNVCMPSNDEIHGQYTAWQAFSQLIIIEELMSQGRQQLANKLKPLITNDRTRVEEKFIPSYQLDNCYNFLMFTNHQDAIFIDNDDRRYFVIFSDAVAKKEEEGKAYFDPLFAILKDEQALGAIMNYLKLRDISEFNGQGHAPYTKAKDDMRLATEGDLESTLRDMFDDYEGPMAQDVVSVSDLEEYLPVFAKRGSCIKQKIIKFLKTELRAVLLPQGRVKGTKQRIRLWAVRRPKLWQQRDVAEVIAEWSEKREGVAPSDDRLDAADDFLD